MLMIGKESTEYSCAILTVSVYFMIYYSADVLIDSFTIKDLGKGGTT